MENALTPELVKFLAASPEDWRSPCAKYEAEIAALLAAKASQMKVRQWLALPPRNLQISPSSLSRWLARQKARKLKATKANLPAVIKAVAPTIGMELARFLDAPTSTPYAPYAKYQAEIYILLGKGETQKRVREWLAMPPRNLQVSRSSLSDWLKRRQKRQAQDIQTGSDNQIELELPAEPVSPAPSVAVPKVQFVLRVPDERKTSPSAIDLALAAAHAVGKARKNEADLTSTVTRQTQEDAASKKNRR